MSDYFEFDLKDDLLQYYEKLESLIIHWENELVEFKEAKNQFDTNRIGKYFSAISNEANLKKQQYGWLIFGVSENNKKQIVGTRYKEGNGLLEKFKYEISQGTNDNLTFTDIIELFPIVEGEKRRVIMFKIPAATTGFPTSWKNYYYARSGESLVFLQQNKIDEIRMQERMDWSKQFIPGATIEDLDKNSIEIAKIKYKEKMNKSHINEEIDRMSDTEFLTKVKLIINGNITNACMILLGKEESDVLLNSSPKIMWRLYANDGSVKDYEIFTIPFIKVIDKIFLKIRNLTYRYIPNQLTLFPIETSQYDTWLLRELLNNCIAHTNYILGGRIYVNEFEDKMIITNPGSFIPESIENVLQVSYNPPFYRNQLLADSMVKFNMIDTATLGIRKIYKIQRDKYFPMPDYDFQTINQVSVTVHGKSLNNNYMHLLYDNPDLDLETVFLLDRVQKNLELTDKEITMLRRKKLVEGRKNNLYLSSKTADTVEENTQYIKNKAFDDQYYKDMIVSYLKEFSSATKKDFKILLIKKLPDILNESQKDKKISNLLRSLKKSGIITTDTNNRTLWMLVDEDKLSRD